MSSLRSVGIVLALGAALAAVAVVLLLVALLVFGIPISYDASPAGVPAEALATAGYADDEPRPYTIERSIAVVDLSITNWIVAYGTGDPTDEDEEVATLAVLSTPDVGVGGWSLNPLTHLDEGDLIEVVLERLDRFDDDEIRAVDEADAEERTILGDEVAVRTYAVSTEAEGEGPLLVHVAIVENEDDVIVLLGVHPGTMDERETLVSLMEVVEHPR